MRSLVGENADDTWFDPENDAMQYLQNFASGQVFDMTKDPSDELAPDADLKAVLYLALQRERDSVVFFLGMKELVPSARGGIKIESIIKEEMSHIALISKRLTQVAF
jgi:rubrerythrin